MKMYRVFKLRDVRDRDWEQLMHNSSMIDDEIVAARCSRLPLVLPDPIPEDAKLVSEHELDAGFTGQEIDSSGPGRFFSVWEDRNNIVTIYAAEAMQ